MSTAAGGPTISVIIPAHNCAATLEAALTSVESQTYADGAIEVVVYNDGSTDATGDIIAAFKAKWSLPAAVRPLTLTFANDSLTGTYREAQVTPHGPGYARNRAVEASTGSFLCLLDADDECHPDRIVKQLDVARRDASLLVGSGFIRHPAGSTDDYTRWANDLDGTQLALQQWRECTIIQPTWFMHRSVYDVIQGWDELPPSLEVEPHAPSSSGLRFQPESLAAAHVVTSQLEALRRGRTGILSSPPSRIPPSSLLSHVFKSFPEDTLFFQRHLNRGGNLNRVPEALITYRYSPGSQSWRIPRDMLLHTRVALFEERVLTRQPQWFKFIIWGAGRDGKAFYRFLSPAAQARVHAFVDIDEKKVGGWYPILSRGVKPDHVRWARHVVEAHGASRSGDEVVEAGVEDAAVGMEGVRSGGKRPRDGPGALVDTRAAKAPRSEALRPLLDAPLPVPIHHFTEYEERAGATAALPMMPIVCCVGLRQAGDELRANVARLPVREGDNFWYFV